MADPSTPTLPQIGEETARELLACPFCGSTEVSVSFSAKLDNPDPSARFIECEDCGAMGPPCDIADHGSDDAAKLAAAACWSSRPALGPPPTEVREGDIRAMLIEVDDFINEPPRLYDIEPMEVRNYRHELYRKWEPLCRAVAALKPATPPMRDREEIADGERSVAQFFFEVGYGACFAEAYIRNGAQVPWAMSDAEVERAWDIAGEAHDDPEEFDRYLALSLSPSPCDCLVREALEKYADPNNWSVDGTFLVPNAANSGPIGGDIARTALQGPGGEGK